jgi:hypothetical protein
MNHPVRAVFTLLGVAGAGFLIWLSTQFGSSASAYWAKIGLLAAAGLVLPLAQLFGGWTKWGWPRFSMHVLLLGFLPAFAIAGWVILSGQPEHNWFQRHVTDWSTDLHVARLVRHFRETYLDVLAFGLGTVFGFSFDTTGPRVPKPVVEPESAPTTTLPAAGAAPIVAHPDAVTTVTPAAPEEPPSTPETAETRVSPPEESAKDS